MESQVDFMKLHTGASFTLPFDVLLMFSTNLHPADLMDAAFLRRIQYKIKLFEPTRDEYHQIFRRWHGRAAWNSARRYSTTSSEC